MYLCFWIPIVIVISIFSLDMYTLPKCYTCIVQNVLVLVNRCYYQ